MTNRFNHIKIKYFHFKWGAIALEWHTRGVCHTKARKNTVRVDHLFGVNRAYHREKRVYVYVFGVGKLRVRWFKN